MNMNENIAFKLISGHLGGGGQAAEEGGKVAQSFVLQMHNNPRQALISPAIASAVSHHGTWGTQ